MRRLCAALAVAALAAALAACGGSDEGDDVTVTVSLTNTVPAADATTVAEGTTAESTPAETTAAETTAEEPTTEVSPTEASEPESTEAPPESTEVPPETTIAEGPTDTGPQQQFTIGNDPATGEEPPPTDTGPAEDPPQTDTAEEPQPGVDRPADFPRAGEQRILGLLAADIANQCTRTSPDEVTRTANVSIYCDLRAGDRVQAWYEGFPSNDVMERAYARFRNGRNISPNTRACQPDQQYPAEAPWYQGDASNILGRLLCFVDQGDVWLVWSDSRNRTLGWAVNRGGKKKIVWDYWAQRGALAAG